MSSRATSAVASTSTRPPPTSSTGNVIGLAANGLAKVANGGSGVLIGPGVLTGGNTVGGTVALARNVISGNSGAGVDDVSQGGDTLEGNYIGLGPDGLTPFGDFFGISLGSGTSLDVIGGTTAAARNVISGNATSGVLFQSSRNNAVIGDYIGTDSTGSTAVGNTVGVTLESASTGNSIGGTLLVDQDVISGNSSQGVLLTDGGTSNNLVAANYIGLAASGVTVVPNGKDGITLTLGASNNTIGGVGGSTPNIISGNGQVGLELSMAGTAGNLVENNAIGVLVTGISAAPNGTGLYIHAGASSNTIGGTVAGTRNVISGNTNFGVEIVDVGTSNNVVEGNFIGPGSDGDPIASAGIGGGHRRVGDRATSSVGPSPTPPT